MSGPVNLPVPVATDFRFKWRVDYFATPDEAAAFAEIKRAANFRVTRMTGAPESYGGHEGVYGVHWCDRPGEGGWYG